MGIEKRYWIILEHSQDMLLENATAEQVEAFWDANDTRYFGLRLENEQSAQVKVIVTDVMPEEEEDL